MPVVNEKVTYLEMREHVRRTLPPPRAGLTLVHAKNPGVAYYRFLYSAVGGRYCWQSRGKLKDEELAALLRNPLNEVHVLHVEGTPAGFAELDRRTEEVELVHFGLMQDYLGQGLGKYFIQLMIDMVWSQGPKRFWLHTCSFDHPAALPNYLKAGFIVTDEIMKMRELP